MANKKTAVITDSFLFSVLLDKKKKVITDRHPEINGISLNVFSELPKHSFRNINKTENKGGHSCPKSITPNNSG